MVNQIQVQLRLVQWLGIVIVLQERLVNFITFVEIKQFDGVTEVLILLLYHHLGATYLDAAQSTPMDDPLLLLLLINPLLLHLKLLPLLLNELLISLFIT